MLKFLLLFTIVPLVELWLLIEIGRLWGALPTVLMVGATGFLGVILLKAQGVMVLYRMREEINKGVMPSGSIFEGILLLLGGAFLVTPGLITDLVGFSFLIPITRAVIKNVLRKAIQKYMSQGNVYIRYW